MKFKKIVTIGIGEQKLDPEYWRRIQALTEKFVMLPKDSPEINKQIADADCLLVNPFVFKVDKNLIDLAQKLKFIGVLATGYGAIDFEYAAKKDVVVCNIPGYSTEAVAEFAFALILDHIRDLDKAKAQIKAGDYSEPTFSNCYEIKSKKFGVVGLGRIGGRIAEIALGFGADVYYWSRNRKKGIEKKGVKYQEIEKLLSECDFISINLALAKETEGFMNTTLVDKIKHNAVLLNLAPNELVDFRALENRLKKGDITYIFDHPDELTIEQARQLSKYKNCIIYPPIGFQTEEARISKQEIFVGNIENFLKGTPTNKVN